MRSIRSGMECRRPSAYDSSKLDSKYEITEVMVSSIIGFEVVNTFFVLILI